MELLAQIPLNQIKSIKIYQNVRRLYMDQVKAITGADYVINGSIYNFYSFKPYGNMKSNGHLVYSPGYSEYGYAWKSGSDISYRVIPCSMPNYIGCAAAVLNGQKQVFHCNSDMLGRRQRTAMGLCDGKLMLYVCNGVNSKTPEKLQDYMISHGWESGLMLDGGGSTQAMFPNGIMKSHENKKRGRIVQNYILVYTNTPKPVKPVGPPICPYREPSTLIRANSRGEGAKWVQWHLNHTMGTTLVLDGIFGRRSVAALESFQKREGLVVDRICGANTRKKLKEKIKK